jgi:outer membrane receptor protein involved in Fe transport
VINQGRTDQKGYGGAAQLTWVTDKNQVTAGISADLARIKFEQTSQLFSEFDAGRGVGGTLESATQEVSLQGSSRTLSIFATDTYNMTSKLALTASGRYNNTHVKNDDLKQASGTGSLTGEATYQRFNPAVGLTYNVVPELNLYGGYNEGNRAPSIIEMGCSDPAAPCLLPNSMAGDPPTLKQVVAKTFEAGVRGKFGEVAKWNISAYRATNNDDLQFIASNSTGAGYFSNVGKTRRQGMDFGLNGVTGDFRWSAGYSYIKATYESTFDIVSNVNSSNHLDAATGLIDVITVKPGDNIPGIPKHQLKFRGEYRVIPAWTVGVSAVLFSDQYARGNENNLHQADGNHFLGSGKIGGYGVLNLDTRYTVAKTGWQVFAKVNNVFDREYFTSAMLGTSGFDANGAFAPGGGENQAFLSPGAPRAGWVGLRYDFGKPKTSAALDAD